MSTIESLNRRDQLMTKEDWDRSSVGLLSAALRHHSLDLWRVVKSSQTTPVDRSEAIQRDEEIGFLQIRVNSIIRFLPKNR